MPVSVHGRYWHGHKQAKKLHFENKEALGVAFAQVLSLVSLQFLVIMIGRLINKSFNDYYGSYLAMEGHVKSGRSVPLT